MTRPDNDIEPGEAGIVAALGRMARQTEVPDLDRRREAQLLAAFDAARRRGRTSRGHWWWMTGLAGATTVADPCRSRSGGSRSCRPRHRPNASSAGRRRRSEAQMVGDFVPWPGAIGLPSLDSGELLRVELPISMLPSLGLRPPCLAGRWSARTCWSDRTASRAPSGLWIRTADS